MDENVWLTETAVPLKRNCIGFNQAKCGFSSVCYELFFGEQDQ